MNDSRLSIEKSVPGRRGITFKNPLRAKAAAAENLRRKTAPRLPEMSEFDAVRHFTNLSKLNYSVDTHFYPLGSCTMKYNPRLNEEASNLKGFTSVHPLSEDEAAQGTLEMLHNLSSRLTELTGMDGITLQPAAGAHGEFTGLLTAKAYFKHRGETERTEVIVPDSAHGTNPATASMAGFSTVNIASEADGRLSLDKLKEKLGSKTAVVMLTIPNTLGIFESRIEEIAEAVHKAGALLYMDGANFNALIGIVKPGDMGVDLMHLNMHKTFSAPHGGGGPGAGAIAAKKFLLPHLPMPLIKKENGKYICDFGDERSAGRVKSFFGNTGVLVKAYAYLLVHSANETGDIARMAILNANYILAKLKDIYPCCSKEHCMHECVLTPGHDMIEKGIKTLDVAKALLDKGFHAPTIYFPLIVHEALMIEPTETESKETLDEFIKAMKEIHEEGLANPDAIKAAPKHQAVKRLDEVMAARKPNIRW